MPAGATYEPIQSTTLQSAQASITFSNISQAYTDLILIMYAISTSANNDIRIQLNGDSGNNYNCNRISSSGATPSGGTVLNNGYFWSFAAVGTNATAQHVEIQIMRYSSSLVQKAAFGKASSPNSTGNGETIMSGFNWNNSSAVTSMYIYSAGNTAPQTLAAGTTATLYGILRA